MDRDLPLFALASSVEMQLAPISGKGLAHGLEFSDNPIANILSSVPEIEKLSASLKDRVNEFIGCKLDKLALKISLSPYIPYTTINDPFGLNQNFPKALCQWLHQFPDSHRLGFLVAALSTTYLPEQETDLFLEIGINRLREAILAETPSPGIMSHILPTNVKDKIRLLPVSSFNDFDCLVHKLQLDGNRDKDRNVSGTLDEFLSKTYNDLRVLAEHKNEDEFIYYLRHAESISQVINTLLSSHIILVEDSSFSGTRISKKVERILTLLNTLFGKFEKSLNEEGYQIPRVYLLVPYGTSRAKETVHPTKFAFYKYFTPIFGFTFDDDSSASKQLPENINKLEEYFAPEGVLYEKLKGAVNFFYHSYGKRYWIEDTQAARTQHYHPETNRSSFMNGDWTIVPYRNCPNNSLQLLWYPHTGSPTTEIKPLFARVESRISHGSQSDKLNEDIQIVREDKNHLLNRFLTRLYQSYLSS